jgi:hypothetical protein
MLWSVIREAKRQGKTVILALSLLIAACSSTVPLRSPLGQAPLVEQVPISVAIRYAEDLRNHKCTVSKGYIAAAWVIELGPPSIEMFDRAFSALFKKVIPLGSGVKVQAAAEQYPMIEVRLLDFDGCEASWPIFGSNIEVAYEATLYGNDGTLIARWQGRGRAGKEACAICGVETGYLSAVTSLAMRRAAADFIINLEQDPSIRVWLQR